MRGIVTLCGSHRFKEIFEEVSQELAIKSWLVLRPEFHRDAHELGTDIKAQLDNIHREKIEMSQAIVVINEGNYVGHETQSELEIARKLGKKVYWWDFEQAVQNRSQPSSYYLYLRGDGFWSDLLLS